jgi:uncharacterized membrane protein YeiH
MLRRLFWICERCDGGGISSMSVEDNGGDRALFAADIVGTLIFAIEGAVAAVRGNLDLMGLMVLAFATALGGGIIRDLLIGDVPPASLKDWRYAATAFAGAAMVFCLHRPIERHMDGSIVILDAAGLSLFAIVGTRKALVYGMNPLVAVLLGTISGVGGGTIRDVLLAQVPTVLRADVYATAALAGAIVMAVTYRVGMPRVWAGAMGGAICFCLRVVSVWGHWNLPRVLGR